MAGRSDRPGAQQWVPERLSKKALATGLHACRGCELHRDATQAVPGEGRTSAPLMVVGEQPGDREDREGLPFVGPAGHLLDRALGEAGIEPRSVFRTNAVKHFRFDPGRAGKRIHKGPSRVHVVACGPWLAAELDLVRPRGVVLLGATAGGAVFGPSFRVGTARGRALGWPGGRIDSTWTPAWAVATTHPAAVLRSRHRDEDYRAFVTDLQIAAELLLSTS